VKPAHGFRFVLERSTTAEALALYRGAIEMPEQSVAIEVTVRQDPSTPDGLAVEPVLEGEPPRDWDEDRRRVLLRQVGTMARSAVRGAKKDGLPPPRRIQRWRNL